MNKTHLLLTCVCYSLLSISLPCLANNHHRIKQINTKISSLRKVLSKEQKQRHLLQQKLAVSETRLGRQTLKLHQTTNNLKKQRQVFQTLENNDTNYQQQLHSQQKTLKQQIRAAYMLGREPYLKMLLNQENINETSRILTYYRYFSQQRLHTITNLQSILGKIEANQQQILLQQKMLTQLQQKQQAEQQRLHHITQHRQRLVQQINAIIHTKTQKLGQLINNKHRLEKTILVLETKNRTFSSQQNFRQLKGKLSWPIKGRIIADFGTKLDQSGLRLGGDVIAAPTGEPIHAIANGKVVFAKWLAGYGLLLIVNHGHGYMTLYGRNHSLYKKVGDVVKAGDTIATVGNSGGFKQPTLYFAIRHNGKPLNPRRWIRKG